VSSAGRNIRSLALRRRTRSLENFALAAAIPMGVIWENVFLHIKVPYWLAAFALPLVSLGLTEWQKANRADQGAAAEEHVGKILSRLPRSWRVEYNVRDRSVGDIDAVVVAPDGRAWAIDTKSHAGEVLVDNQGLYRKLGTKTLRFDGDFLAKSKKQARVAKDYLRVRWVEPVLCFTRASINFRNRKVSGVYVITAKELIDFLTS
jgi:Nuclease-related domain